MRSTSINLSPDDMADDKILCKIATEAMNLQLQEVATILHKVKAGDTESKNIANLGSKSDTRDLAQTYAFLLNMDEKDEEVDKLTKQGLQTMIMYRLKQLMPVGCRKCNTVYTNDRLGAPQVTCRMCGVGACQDCFPSEERKNKWFFLCGKCDEFVVRKMGEEALDKKCLKADKKKKNVKVNARVPELEEEVLIEDEEGDIGDDEDENGIDDEGENLDEGAFQDVAPKKKKSDKEEGKKMPICHHFKRGRCRHGLSGKKSVDGVEKCPFRHPRICGKLLRNGDRGKGGCRGQIDGCGEFHEVRMCFSSMNTKTCSQKDCPKGYHVRGTVFKSADKEKDVVNDDVEKRPKPNPWGQAAGKQGDNDKNVASFLGQMLLQQQEMMQQQQKLAQEQRTEQMHFQQQLLQMMSRMGGATEGRSVSQIAPNQMGVMQQQPLNFRQVV